MYFAGTCPIVTRAEWGAKPPTYVEHIPSALSHVIIHHSESPGPCGGAGQPTCASAMQSMQNYHQQNNGWCDIGYRSVFLCLEYLENFLIEK